MPFFGHSEILLAFLLVVCVFPAQSRICGNVYVKNNLNTLERQLRNCTVLTGNMQISLLERLSSAEFERYSFPELREVYGFVLFFRVYSFNSLGMWFPNLTVIRGFETFEDVSLILDSVPQLVEIGLKNLRRIENGQVWISNCGELCFATTVNWTALGTRLQFKEGASLIKTCPKCDPKCTDGFCWDENTCQNTTFHQCPNYEYNGECVKKCPKNSSILGKGKKCILNDDCYQLEPTYKNLAWFIFNGTCTYTCPSKHMMVNQTTCVWCGENCTKTCKGGEINNESILSEFLDCKHINGSLILRVTDIKTYNLLEKYLGDVVVISEALKIQRSPAIQSLSFLKKLRKIGGLKQIGVNSTKVISKSFVVLDNHNLAKLWDWDGFNLEIEHGGIWFHYNHRLCLNEIKTFAEKAHLNYTELDVSLTSNGDQGICEPYSHTVEIININPRNVTLKWKVINSTYEGYFVYYKETGKNDAGTCGDDWNVVVGRANTPVVLTNLFPFVNYTYYLMMNGNSSHPYSKTKRFYFKTNPDDPPMPGRVRAFSDAWDSMTITWEHPWAPGGILSYYVISYFEEKDNRTFMDQRNYCNSKNLIHSMKKYETLFRETMIPEKKCVCKDKGILAHDMCNFYGLTSQQRDMYDCKSHDAYRTFNEEFPKTHGRAKRDYLRTDMKEMKVDAPNNMYLVRGLSPFTIYVFLVSVCNKQFEGRHLCSEIVMVYNRTLPRFGADEVENLKGVLKDRNLQISWGEPLNPNSVVVSYEIEHKTEGTKGITTTCVSRVQHEESKHTYSIYNLQPGKHYVKVRAVSLAGPGKFINITPVTVRDDRVELILIIGVSILGLIVCTVVGLYLYYRWKKKHEFEQMYLIASINPDYTGVTYVPDEWEIPRSDVEIRREIGQGSFGMVFSGFIKSQKMPCAIKTISDDAAVDKHMEFLNEASMMKSFSGAHHVVKLLGVASQCKPPLVVMELMECGDLKFFLRKSRDSSHAITNNEMYRMAAEIADGMAYLSAKKFVHRDLAARNCMVSGDHTIKIGDFGMTRDIYQSDYYRKDSRGFFPVRWMAPESLADGVFSSDSDVWSYGVVLWEMTTLAEQPYQGLANEQVLQFITNRGTLQRPPDCSDILYEIMHVCWKYRPNQRPQFIDIVNRLQNLVGEDFKLVSYYHNREREEYKVRDRSNNAPVLYARYDISGDDVSIYNDEDH